MSAIKLYGGPLDGAEVQPPEVKDGVLRASVTRRMYRPFSKEAGMQYLDFAKSVDETEFRTKYELRGGRLVHAGGCQG